MATLIGSSNIFAFLFQQLITKQARQRIEEETRKRIEERRKFITEKCGQPKDLNGLSDGNITILKILIGKAADFAHCA